MNMLPASRLIGASLAAWLLLAGCSRPQAPAEDTGPADQPATASLAQLVAQYYEDSLELNPLAATFDGDHRYDDRLANTISERWLADSLALEQRYLEAARQFDRDALSPPDRLTLDMFVYGRESAIEASRYPSELLPLNQMGSLPALFVQMGSGTSVQPFATVEDYEKFLGRIADFVVWCDQAIANMRVGIDRGVVLPRVIVAKTIPQLTAQIVEDPTDSIFYRPVASFPDTVPESERTRLASAYRAAISEQLVPAYAELARFLEQDYLPAARESTGLSDLPGGSAWYASLARRYTTTELSPAEIHAIGMAEVERIRSAMDGIRAEVGFKGDLAAFIEHLKAAPEFKFETPEELLEAYRALRERVDAVVPELFSLTPRTDFEVRPVEAFREQSAPPASYLSAPPDGDRPAVFYVNTYDVTSRPSYMVPSIYLHEAVPGHHFQIALQQEKTDLPAFRRFAGLTAYAEGWGLYAESLGAELGQYDDPYVRFGALTAEAWRAVRLVVDTGLHTLGWSREQAIAYMTDNTPLGATDVVNEVDRYIAIPGQALAYKIGQLKLSELRQRAEQRLAGRFDIRAFHAMLLEDGALPLAVLERKAEEWIESVEQAAVEPGQPSSS